MRCYRSTRSGSCLAAQNRVPGISDAVAWEISQKATKDQTAKNLPVLHPKAGQLAAAVGLEQLHLVKLQNRDKMLRVPT